MWHQFKLRRTTMQTILQASHRGSANLTRAYQDEIALWQVGEVSNEALAGLTSTYLVNFTKNMNEFNQTEAPATFVSAKNSLVNSFNNEIKSYQVL